MNSLTALYIAAQMTLARTRDRLAAEDGQTAIEWLGIAAVIVAIVAFLAGDPAQAMGELIRDTFNRLIGEATGAS